ncbi:unnamed protein product [Phaeothamnion confervicola]
MATPPPNTPQGNLHEGSKTKLESVDVEASIAKTGCAKEYYALEACIVEKGRDWSLCQPEVKLLRECTQRAQQRMKERCS